MTGSVAMASARSACITIQHAGASHWNVRGEIIAVVVVLALIQRGFDTLTTQRTQSDTEATQVVSYIVRPGGTFWSYASTIISAGHDVSETVNRLIALNNLEPGLLQTRQRIAVPVE